MMVLFHKKFLTISLLTILLEIQSCSGKPKVTIRGGGATIPLDVYKALQPAYQAMRMHYAEVNVLYRGVGSGTGIQMLRNGLLDFAGSDAEPSEDNTDDDLQYFPVMSGSLSVVYNLPDDVTGSLGNTSSDNQGARKNSIFLTKETLVGIFNGTIGMWNDRLLVENNEFLRNVNQPIVVVVRADNSGTTHIFTKTLAAFNPQWNADTGVFSEGCDGAMKPIRWNKSMEILCGKYSRGASGIVLNTPYSIGYLGSSDARDSVLPEATLRNDFGQWTSPATGVGETTNTPENLPPPDDASSSTPSSTRVTNLKSAYPFSAYTYLVIKKSPPKNCTIVMELYRYFRFILEDPIARNTIRDSTRIPVSSELAGTIGRDVLDTLRCRGQLVARLVEIETATLNGDYDRWQVPVAVTLALIGVVAITTGVFFLYHFYIRYQDVLKATYVVTLNEHVTAGSQLSIKSKGSLMTSGTRASSVSSKHFGTEYQVVRLNDGEYRLARSLPLQLQNPEMYTWITRKTMVTMQKLKHVNITSFYGICCRANSNWMLVSPCPLKGNLKDFLLKRGNYPEVVTFALARDLVEGLNFVHKQHIVHGQLSIRSCFVDHHWNGAIADWELHALTTAQKCPFIAFEHFYKAIGVSADEGLINQKVETYHNHLFYSAPELLMRDSAGLYIIQSADMRGDIYSLGMILYEIFTGSSPYDDLSDAHNSASSILTFIKYKKARPRILPNILQEYPSIFALVRSMWVEDASERPTVIAVKKFTHKIFPKRKALIDNMLQSLENCNRDLEDKLTEKLMELETATRNVEDLKAALVPAAVTAQASQPSTFESVAVCILTGSNLLPAFAEMDMIEAFDFLERFQSFHDALLAKYSIVKVDSVGYLSVYLAGILPHGSTSNDSGRNAENAAEFVLSLIDDRNQNALPDFLREKSIPWQAGMHFGNVMGGLIQVSKVPRFYVLGETVRRAFQLHSYSKPTRVLISDVFKSQLASNKTYRTVPAHYTGVEDAISDPAFWLSYNDDESD